MNAIRPGDELELWNGQVGIARSTAGKDSTGSLIVSCEVDGYVCIPVRVTAIVGVRRGGERLWWQQSLFEDTP